MTKSKWKDPGIIMVIALVVISAIVWIWWPTEVYWMGISLAGWLMFFCFFVWLLLTFLYVIWIEKIEKQPDGESDKR
ncbi:hypothetical protein [Halobacillus sp. A5]|uniref:hypothetical protein n=1 Tax=Halobacillus sp. A5 TaxID=2880263 RepID=UPI0020A63E18|nr:hypothetical protein [Halobacillus sp. A5]MCP3027142.1 hypothetical protein [Halobacillus sp. A5]